MRIHFAEIVEIAARYGLKAVGVASVERLEEELLRLARWQQQGCAAEMQYMQRPAELLASPRAILPSARSVISFTVSYASSPHPPLSRGFGRVARYAWGQDYHQVLPRALAAFAEGVKARIGPACEVRICTDSVPLLERALAAKAQLGFVGKSTMLIRPREGSFFFVAEVLTNVEVEGVGLPVVRGGCGSCVRCQTGCPTNAIDQAYRVDARRCISYLTIEKRGVLSESERSMIGEWVFGCDTCQDVCPFNHRAQVGLGPEVRAEFSPEQGIGPLLDLAGVLRIRSADEFQRRFGHTALTRTRRAGLVRNAAIVAGNTGALEAFEALRESALQDPSPTVRLHCAAAMHVLHPAMSAAQVKAARAVLEKLRTDPDPEVALQACQQLEE